MQAAVEATKAFCNALLNYLLHSIGPKTLFTDINTTAYASSKWAVGEKLKVDLIIFQTQDDCMDYTFSQLTQLIFQQLDAWMHAFLKKVKYYIEIFMLAAKTKRELNTIVMQINKSVNEYYHWLFKL